MKRPRESDGARTPRKRFNGSSRIATCANKQQARRIHSYTRAAEATTNRENDNEPRRTASNMKPARESDGAPTPRKELNGSSRSAIYANRRSKPVSYTHTTKSFMQINGRRRQAQNAGAEHKKRA